MASHTIAEALQQSQAGPSGSVYSHPYYKVDEKGKGRQTEEQLEQILEVKQAIALAQTALSRRDGDWGKLARSLREIAGHSQALLPFPSSLPRPSPNRPIIPSRLVHLSPAELLDTIARQLDIQVFSEDSQFGLLKQSLAIAGSCFVVDIDLETDAVPDETSEADTTGELGGSGGGKVRLSKLDVNHVNATGGNEASPHVKAVLENVVGRYLEARYAEAEGYKAERERVKEVQRCIDRVKDALRAVKDMDGDAEAKGSLFTPLEEAAKRVQGLDKSQTVYAAPAVSVLPAFTLVPQGPILQLRPTTSEGGWVLRPESPIPVSRSWLDPTLQTGNVYDGGVKVENLWYKPTPSDINSFPSSSSFTHVPLESSAQTWRLARPGPDGYLVNTIRLLDLDGDLERMIKALRRQVVLQTLASQVFEVDKVAQPDDDEGDLDDLLDEPMSIPLDVHLEGDRIVIRSPLPHSDPASSAVLQVTATPQDTAPWVSISSDITPLDDEISNKVNAAISGCIGQAKKVVRLVDVIAAIDQILRV